jgi:integrase
MTAVPQLVPSPFRAATFQTMIGLLAVTGMRVGEVIALGRCDVDWAEGLLVIRDSKFGKSREVVLDPTTAEALACYARFRDQRVPRPASPAFFISAKGTPVIYADFGEFFRKLVTLSGVGAGSPVSPRIHDLRHSFAVQTLIRWHQAGEDVGALLPRLSTT